MTQNNICTHDTVSQACAERCCSKHSMFHDISRYEQHVGVLQNNNCCLQAACAPENALTIRNGLQYLLPTCQTSILSCQKACATLRLTICSVTTTYKAKHLLSTCFQGTTRDFEVNQAAPRLKTTSAHMIQCVKLAQSVVAANTACFMTFHAMSNMYKCSTTIIAACKQLANMK